MPDDLLTRRHDRQDRCAESTRQQAVARFNRIRAAYRDVQSLGFFLQRMAACDVSGTAMVMPSPAEPPQGLKEPEKSLQLAKREGTGPAAGEAGWPVNSSGAGSCRKRDQQIVYPNKSAIHVKFFYALGLRYPAQPRG